VIVMRNLPHNLRVGETEIYGHCIIICFRFFNVSLIKYSHATMARINNVEEGHLYSVF